MKNNSQNPTKSPAIAERRRKQAFALRSTGLTWAAVGEAMGISATAAQLLVHRHDAPPPRRAGMPLRSLRARDVRRVHRQALAVQMQSQGKMLSQISEALKTSNAVASRLLNGGRSERHAQALALLQAREQKRDETKAALALHRAGCTWVVVEERMGRAAVIRARKIRSEVA